jgi:8-oxo-dGTP pyrophosphatase MutT (NUDIX family)
MRQRLTARILLFDPTDRLLLMKGRLPSDAEGPGAWFTVGGGALPDEDVLQAARREVAEETGFADVTFGPVVWRREAVHRLLDGRPARFKEHYLVARCSGGEPCRDGWEAHEHSLVDDIRWWTLAQIRASDEPIYPLDLGRLLPDVLAGRYPPEPLTIR